MSTYTIEEIRRIAGDLHRHARDENETWARAVLRATAPISYVYFEDAVPASTVRFPAMRRRIRHIRWRLADYRGRLSTAREVLRGEHYCDY